MSDFEQWWKSEKLKQWDYPDAPMPKAWGDHNKPRAAEIWQAAKQSMHGEAKKLHMFEPDYRLIGCANCGSHDVGAGHTIAHCYGCKDKVQGESVEDTVEKWNNKQLATLSGSAPGSASNISKQDADIARLKAEIETLYTTMMAAAVEIQEHWDAHCDDEGYGPANLMNRLESGIASRYGYDAKTVVSMETHISEQDARIKELEQQLEVARRRLFLLNLN